MRLALVLIAFAELDGGKHSGKEITMRAWHCLLDMSGVPTNRGIMFKEELERARRCIWRVRSEQSWVVTRVSSR